MEIENQLKSELKKDDSFRLSDYFDYIGGTSTGAIIAAGLSLGMSVNELLKFYKDKGEAMFDKSFLLKRVKHFYNDGTLLKELKNTFGEGDINIASDRFKTLLLIVTMNRTTDSPYLLKYLILKVKQLDGSMILMTRQENFFIEDLMIKFMFGTMA